MKLSPEEIIDRNRRRREYESRQKEVADQTKLMKKLNFAEKPLIERVGIYLLQGMGLIFGIVLVISLIW